MKSLQYDTHIQYLKGVGPKLGDVLRRRGVGTVGELLDWFPRSYEDRRAARTVSSLEADQVVSLKASVIAVRQMNMGKSHRKIYEILVGDSTGRIGCKYFRVPYRGYFERFTPHQSVRISGKVTLYRGKKEFHHPDIQIIGSEEEDGLSDALIPLYTETEGLSTGKFRRIMETALNEIVNPQPPLVPEAFSPWMREKYSLLTRAEALKKIHEPDIEEGEALLEFRSPAQKRIIFEEFFWLELQMAYKRAGLRKEQAPRLSPDLKLANNVQASLPFQLTGAQERVFAEILSDLKKPHPMHRLVQGDVGSGKTLVAFLAAAVAIEAGHQVALMAPTEILAEQHFKNAQKFLSSHGVRAELITGSLAGKKHEEACLRVKSGEIELVIGTHALIEEDVDFKDLGLVIVDEQHRFGVDQRNRLKKKKHPHFLVMTATPIPRTLAMTVYGDLDISTVDELPPGRSPIVTKKVFQSKRDKVFGFIKEQVQKGRQAYVIYPLVDESEKIDLKNAIQEHEEISNMFPEFQVGLLHGKMKPKEKDEIMGHFRDGRIHILVSTTVIEVGVDVPNANIMVIEHAERFGLSQLHQLRGRVGRGVHKSYCVLMLGHALSEDSVKRAEIIEGTTDGFKISEADLELRGPGEFLGRRQSGLPGFKMANLVRDLPILKQARDAAHQLLEVDPELKKPEHQLIREKFIAQQNQIVG